jgi:hypothetical protein
MLVGSTGAACLLAAQFLVAGSKRRHRLRCSEDRLLLSEARLSVRHKRGAAVWRVRTSMR